jgi:uncharacterized protein (DUF1919 family)
MSFESDYQITQTFTIGKLSEHHREKLIPTGQVSDITVSVVLCNDASELEAIKKFD